MSRPDDIATRWAIMIDVFVGARNLGFSGIAPEYWRRSLKEPIEELERWRRENWTRAKMERPQ